MKLKPNFEPNCYSVVLLYTWIEKKGEIGSATIFSFYKEKK